MTQAMDKLRHGVARFQHDVYPKHADEYRRAASEPQRPHTLLITCADSRIDIETITQSGPGQLFVLRNVGNVVPAFGEMLGGVSAVVEYAVAYLKVEQVVICGHSDCGAMKALLDPASLETLPTVDRWLQNCHAAVSVSRSMAVKDERPSEALTRLTERNVILQLQHLATHPAVAGALAQGKLQLFGWVYDIASGGIRMVQHGEIHFAALE